MQASLQVGYSRGRRGSPGMWGDNTDLGSTGTAQRGSKVYIAQP